MLDLVGNLAFWFSHLKLIIYFKFIIDEEWKAATKYVTTVVTVVIECMLYLVFKVFS